MRHGISSTNWRIAELTILMILFSSPEAKQPHRIVVAANAKEIEIIRRAVAVTASKELPWCIVTGELA